jgi:hypothetical protein
MAVYWTVQDLEKHFGRAKAVQMLGGADRLHTQMQQQRHGNARPKAGFRADLGIFVRSGYEANYARYLRFLQANGSILSWEYEPKTFVFEGIKRGIRAYLPDFRVVPEQGIHEWHEVKGWMDPKSKTRLARMKKYYPKEKVILIDQYWFRDITRQGIPNMIPHWE